MVFFQRLILVLFLQSLTHVHGAIASVECSSIFVSSKVLNDSITTNWADATIKKTVRFVGERPGKHGGKLFIIQRTGESWISKYGTFLFDVQGDPRWFIGAVGVETARFFGFEVLDPEHITIPDAVEFQGSVDKVNQQLTKQGIQPIPLSFVGADLTDRPLSGYIEHFLNGRLAIATGDHHLVHDMSFHSGAIYLDPADVLTAQIRIRFVQKFVDFLLEDKNFFNKHDQQKIKHYMNAFLVRGIDNGTAFGNLIMLAKNSDDPNIITAISALIPRINDSGVSPLQYALVPKVHLMLGMIDPEIYYKDPRLKFRLPQKTSDELFLEEYTLHLVRGVLDFWTPGHPLVLKLGLNHLLPTPAKPSHSELLRKMNEFRATPEGATATLDLTKELSPPQQGLWNGRVVFTWDDAEAALNKATTREKEITEAVRAILNSN